MLMQLPPAARTGGQRVFRAVLPTFVVVVAWITVRPLGVTGTAGATAALLVLNSALIFLRSAPFGRMRPTTEITVVMLWAVAAAGLLALNSLSIAPTFAFFVAGHAGYRLGSRDALLVAGGTGVLAALGLLISGANGIDGWPWLLGLTVALPVFIGMANRSRDLAVASALSAAQARERAAESQARAEGLAERARISRDVHDVLAHSLSGVNMQLELGDMLLERGNVEAAREALGKARSMVREGMVEARRAVQDSRAEILPLRASLEAMFAGTAEVTVTGAVRELPTAVTQAVVRIAQESLSNSRRHAPGAVVEVSLAYGPGTVGLVVTNGPALRPDASPGVSTEGSGMGLVGMRERVALLDGRVDAGPLGDGWSVSAVLPTVDPADADEQEGL
ncbi:two-component sensor histidine kinase [Nakamurella silvestris]|nr:two-component sensor histidine kinase [Nakamurella silvestris]